MNILARQKGMVCLGVLLGSPGVAADYVTDLDQAVWRAEQNANRCVLEHRIGQVALARFTASRQQSPVLEVEWQARGIQGGEATLAVVPAPWQQMPARPLSQSRWQRQHLQFDQRTSDALNALAEGHWLAISEPGNPHRMVISGIHFQQAHNAFRLCRGEAGSERALTSERLTLHFRSGARALSPEQRRQLASLAERIEQLRPGSLLIESHTDNSGDDALNLRLSRQRAEQVADELRRFHPTLPMAVRAFGETYPSTDNTTAAGRYQNRRVVITFNKAEQAS